MTGYRFNRDAYLERIQWNGSLSPTVETLRGLHHGHLYTIPFENFDIQLGRGIDLDPGALFDKLVNRPRGGYCFELNGLFTMALKAFGFDVRPLLARVHVTGRPTGRGHQIELVTIRGRQWIADVGFGGDTPRAPVPLELDRPVRHDGRLIRLIDAARFGIMLQAFTDGRWVDLYSFDLGHVFPADIDYGNHFTSTHPSSFFTSARVAALPVENGGITLFNTMLRRVVGGEEEVQELAEGRPYLDALKSNFGIELKEPYEALRPLSQPGQDNGPGF